MPDEVFFVFVGLGVVQLAVLVVEWRMMRGFRSGYYNAVARLPLRMEDVPGAEAALAQVPFEGTADRLAYRYDPEDQTIYMNSASLFARRAQMVGAVRWEGGRLQMRWAPWPSMLVLSGLVIAPLTLVAMGGFLNAQSAEGQGIPWLGLVGAGAAMFLLGGALNAWMWLRHAKAMRDLLEAELLDAVRLAELPNTR